MHGIGSRRSPVERLGVGGPVLAAAGGGARTAAPAAWALGMSWLASQATTVSNYKQSWPLQAACSWAGETRASVSCRPRRRQSNRVPPSLCLLITQPFLMLA